MATFVNDTHSGADASHSILLINQRWFSGELRALGHRVVCAGASSSGFDISFSRYEHIQEVLARVPADFYPDRIVYLDDSNPLALLGFEECTIPSVFLSVDAHHHAIWHRGLACMFSKTLVAQKDYVEPIAAFWDEGDPCRPQWFPLWAPHYAEPEARKTIDVCFRGTLDRSLNPARVQFFERVGQAVAVDAAQGRYLDAYPHAKIVINQCVKEDVNFRVFEAMMCGAMLLTPSVPNGLEELFTPDEELVLYRDGDAAHAAELAAHYLLHEDTRSRIAEAGRAKVLAQHTSRKRAEQLVSILHRLEHRAHPRRWYGAGIAYLNAACAERRIRNFAPAGPPESELLTRSVKCLLQSVKAQEVTQVQMESAALLCLSLLDERGSKGSSAHLIEMLARTYRESITFQLCYIDSLLESGRDALAAEVAAAASEAPEILLENASRVLADAKQKVLSSICFYSTPTADSR